MTSPRPALRARVTSCPTSSRAFCAIISILGFVLLVSPAMAGSLVLLAQPSALAAAAGSAGFIVTLFFYAHVVGMLGFQLSCYRDGDPLDRMHDPASDQD